MRVSLGARSRKKAEVNRMKSGEDYSRIFGRNIYKSQGSHAGVGGHIEDFGFLSMSNKTC